MFDSFFVFFLLTMFWFDFTGSVFWTFSFTLFLLFLSLVLFIDPFLF